MQPRKLSSFLIVTSDKILKRVKSFYSGILSLTSYFRKPELNLCLSLNLVLNPPLSNTRTPYPLYRLSGPGIDCSYVEEKILFRSRIMYSRKIKAYQVGIQREILDESDISEQGRYFGQRISRAIQSVNAASLLDSLPVDSDADEIFGAILQLGRLDQILCHVQIGVNIGHYWYKN